MNATTEKRPNVAPIGFPDARHANRARAEWPYEVALVYLDACLIDDTFQRPEQRTFVKNLIENFDETLVGTISVNERKNGKLSILDGQQRYLAMQAKNKTACYATVYRGMTVQDEAGFFYRMNKDRKSMEAFYGFRARRVAGDPTAQAITEIVEAQGFIVGNASNDNEVIGAVRALEVAFHLTTEMREDSLTPALRTIRESVYGRKGSLDAWIIQGLARFWSLTEDEEVQPKLLNDILSDYGPAGMLAIIRERQAQQQGKRTQPQLVAQFLAARYNAGAKQTGATKLVLNRYS